MIPGYIVVVYIHLFAATLVRGYGYAIPWRFAVSWLAAINIGYYSGNSPVAFAKRVPVALKYTAVFRLSYGAPGMRKVSRVHGKKKSVPTLLSYPFARRTYVHRRKQRGGG